MALSASLIAIGDELVTGRTLNTNCTHLARFLGQDGITVHEVLTLRDRQADIVAALEDFFSKKKPPTQKTPNPPRRPNNKNKIGDDEDVREDEDIDVDVDIAILTGGLGSTKDDLTVAAVAAALGRKVVTDQAQLDRLKHIQQERHLPPSFLRQAKKPAGFTAEVSHFGTAPFLYFLSKRPFKAIFLLPGVPNECLSLCQTRVLPLIRKHFPAARRQKQTVEQSLKVIGLSETVTENEIRSLDNPSHLQYAYLPRFGELLVVIKDLREHLPLATRQRSLRQAQQKILKHLTTLGHQEPRQPFFCYPGDTNLLEKLHAEWIARKWQVAIAESCTGGLMSAKLSELPGASAIFETGLVTYSNTAKRKFLGVRQVTLNTHGAVSKECAREMAIGLGNLTKKMKSLPVKSSASPIMTLSITGIAGPGGGTKKKPVGTVFIGLHLRYPAIAAATKRPRSPLQQTEVIALKLKEGSRERIRQETVQRAIVAIAQFLHKHAGFFS